MGSAGAGRERVRVCGNVVGSGKWGWEGGPRPRGAAEQRGRRGVTKVPAAGPAGTGEWS